MTGAPRVLVTGATGFVGTALVERLVTEGWPVRAALRRKSDSVRTGVERVVVGEHDGSSDWRSALASRECVIHLAGRAHVTAERASDPLAEFRRTNLEGTLNLAQQAAEQGVRRFVFLSTVKVNGESGAYSEHDPAMPAGPYGVSKHEAEQGLRRIAAKTGMELVIIRPPLVYGPGVKANFRALIRALYRGIPLPLGAIENRRSLIAIDNLIDFIITCAQHQAAANETFLVSDGEDLTVTDLCRRLAAAMGRPARLIPVPPAVLMAAATLAGKRQAAEKLVLPLLIDASRARLLLGWTPPVSVADGLRRTVAGSSW